MGEHDDELIEIERERLALERERAERERQRDAALAEAAEAYRRESKKNRIMANLGCAGCLWLLVGPPVLIIVLALLFSLAEHLGIVK